MKKILFLSILLIQIGILQAQNYYYINPKTGIRERLFWMPTPLGTDGRYITDNESGEPKLLKIMGDPLKQKTVSIVLPSNETAILSSKGTDIQLKFASGKTRIYENRSYWVDFAKKPVVDYIAVKYIWNKSTNQTDIRMFFRGLGIKEEVEMLVLEKDEDKNKYIVTIPNKEGKYKIEEIEIEYERYWKLISPDGKTQNFKGEF